MVPSVGSNFGGDGLFEEIFVDRVDRERGFGAGDGEGVSGVQEFRGPAEFGAKSVIDQWFRL
jgi:hypothetical protein